jgi:hypothetical protein
MSRSAPCAHLKLHKIISLMLFTSCHDQDLFDRISTKVRPNFTGLSGWLHCCFSPRVTGG